MSAATKARAWSRSRPTVPCQSGSATGRATPSVGTRPIRLIRQRDRSDHDYPGIGHFPDTGQHMTWRLRWEHTAMLVEEARASATMTCPRSARPRPSRSPPGWPPVTGRPTRPGCPGSPLPIRSETDVDEAYYGDLAGRLYGLLIRLDDRLC